MHDDLCIFSSSVMGPVHGLVGSCSILAQPWQEFLCRREHSKGMVSRMPGEG